MSSDVELSGIVIAGGRSRRFGVDKRRLRLWGEGGPHLLGHTVALLQPLCVETIVVLNDAEAWSDLPARIVPDEQPGSGALGGLISGLQAMRAPAALVIAADMPLIVPEVLAALAQWPFTGDALAPTPPASLINHSHCSLSTGKARSRSCAGPLPLANAVCKLH